MTTVEKLYKVGSQLPPSAQAELLDFAEFLQQRCASKNKSRTSSLADLKGGLENSSTFVGAPLAIQEKLRNEWN